VYATNTLIIGVVSVAASVTDNLLSNSCEFFVSNLKQWDIQV
jgi:hypothetical protein